MPTKLEVHWEIEDGCAGEASPQKSIIDLEDLWWDGITPSEMYEEVEAVVQHDFEQRISWGVSNPDEVQEVVLKFLEAGGGGKDTP